MPHPTPARSHSKCKAGVSVVSIHPWHTSVVKRPLLVQLRALMPVVQNGNCRGGEEPVSAGGEIGGQGGET